MVPEGESKRGLASRPRSPRKYREHTHLRQWLPASFPQKREASLESGAVAISGECCLVKHICAPQIQISLLVHILHVSV